MRQMLEHFDPSLFPWARFEAPDISADLIDRMEEGCVELTEDASIEDLERKRDRELLGILESLAKSDQGAGRILTRHRQKIAQLEEG